MPPRTFLIIWKFSGRDFITVDDEARSLYKDESDWEIAAAMACLDDDPFKVNANIQDVREV